MKYLNNADEGVVDEGGIKEANKDDLHYTRLVSVLKSIFCT